jgi:hypothetical protein
MAVREKRAGAGPQRGIAQGAPQGLADRGDLALERQTARTRAGVTTRSAGYLVQGHW